MRYEGYGPGGIALIVEALTDNRNRTASNVRAAFTKAGGAMGETGSVSFMWDRVGEIVYPAKAGSADKVMDAAIEAGADDVQSDEDGHTITLRLREPRRSLQGAGRRARRGRIGEDRSGSRRTTCRSTRSARSR